MSVDEDDYGDFVDEDFIEALSQASQTLPPQRRTYRDETESGDEGGNGKPKKRKYKIHEGVDEVPKASMYFWQDNITSSLLTFCSNIRSYTSRRSQPRFKPL
jgi:hypothetical protein